MTSDGSYRATAVGEIPAITTISIDAIASNLIEFEAEMGLGTSQDIVFDYHNPTEFKFALVFQQTGQVAIGHRLQ